MRGREWVALGQKEKKTQKAKATATSQDIFYSLFIVCPCADMAGDRCPMACVRMSCATLLISIPRGSRGHINVTAVSYGAVREKKETARAFNCTPSGWTRQRPSLKNKAYAPQDVLRDKERGNGFGRKKEKERGLADRCGEGRSRQTPSFLSSGGIAGILTSIVSCQVSSLLVG